MVVDDVSLKEMYRNTIKAPGDTWAEGPDEGRPCSWSGWPHGIRLSNMLIYNITTLFSVIYK